MSSLSIIFSLSKDFEDNNVRYKMRITKKLLNKSTPTYALVIFDN